MHYVFGEKRFLYIPEHTIPFLRNIPCKKYFYRSAVGAERACAVSTRLTAVHIV